MEIREKIRKAIDSKKLIAGFSSVRKGVMNKEISEIIIAKNCPEDMKERLIAYAEELGLPVHVLDEDNVELGIMCKKNFKVSVAGIKK